MSDLLPCPFCGGEAETTLGPIPGKWGAWCKECDVWRDDRMASEKEAAMVWNTRAIPAADARAGALKAILDERGKVFDAMVDAAEYAAGQDVSFNVVVGRAIWAAIDALIGGAE